MPRMLETTEAQPIRPVGSVMAAMAPAPSPRDAEILATVHGLALEFATMPPASRPAFLGEVRKLTTGYDRFRATTRTTPDHPAFGPLMAMLDGLIATDPRVISTDRGLFERAELADAAAAISPTKVSLPVAIRNGQAVFPSHTGPEITPFRVVRPDEVKRAASMWGDE